MLKRLFSIKYSPEAFDWAMMILRFGFSTMMLTHGYDKFLSLIGGNWDFPNPIGLGAPLSKILTVFSEFICPILLITGLATRWAALVLVIEMLVVVFIVHDGHPMADKEHGLMFLFAFAALALLGAGKLSLDFLINKPKFK